jgi:hypothetical protein
MAGRGRRARLTGRGYLEVLPKTLDTLVHERGVPAMVAIMINSGGGDSKGSQRGLKFNPDSGLDAECRPSSTFARWPFNVFP